MQNTFDYINIREVLSRLQRNKLLYDLTLEAVIQYTIDFIRIVGLKQSYKSKEEIIQVNNYRALLPCDLVSIKGIKECKYGVALRAMTNTFNLKDKDSIEFTYKVQNRVLFCGIKECELLVSYLATAVDEEGIPMIPEDPMWLLTLELYIKQLIYSDKFDLGEINQASLQNAQQQYSFRVGQLINRYSTPSIDEMESLKNSWCTLLQNSNAHSDGFKNYSRPELLRRH